jgi:hypothetical protein
MRVKMGDISGNINVLKDMRDRLMAESRDSETMIVEDERWGSFFEVSEEIVLACENRDLDDLVVAVRKMKNRLRRPSVRKELARLEAKDDDVSGKAKSPTGMCKCDNCGKVIDGSKEPCVDGVLCTDCALKKNVVSKKEQDRKKRKKAVHPGMAGMGGEGGGGGGGDDGGGSDGVDDSTSDAGSEKKESHSLRRRGYLG